MRLISFTLLILLSSGAHANAPFPECPIDDSAYIHINGINTLKKDAQENADRLS